MLFKNMQNIILVIGLIVTLALAIWLVSCWQQQQVLKRRKLSEDFPALDASVYDTSMSLPVLPQDDHFDMRPISSGVLMNPALDYWAEFAVSRSMSDHVLADAMKDMAKLSKPLIWQGLLATDEWMALLPHQMPSQAVRIRVSIQLIDTTGPLDEVMLAKFRDAVRYYAERWRTEHRFATNKFALTHAAALFAAYEQANIAAVVTLMPKQANAVFQGEDILKLCRADGGHFVFLDGVLGYEVDEQILFTIEQVNGEVFVVDDMPLLRCKGLAFVLDVPRQTNGMAAFERLLLVANEWSVALRGILLDDGGRMMNHKVTGQMREQLTQIYHDLEVNNIPAGSAAAQRLFF